MDTKSNFDRARKVIESWPAWKRDYQLIKANTDEQRHREQPQQANKEVEEHTL